MEHVVGSVLYYYVDSSSSFSSHVGRQLAPGLILMPEGTCLMNNNATSDNKPNLAYTSLAQGRSGGVGGTTTVTPLNRAPGAPVQTMPGGSDQPLNGQATMAIAKELLETGEVSFFCCVVFLTASVVSQFSTNLVESLNCKKSDISSSYVMRLLRFRCCPIRCFVCLTASYGPPFISVVDVSGGGGVNFQQTHLLNYFTELGCNLVKVDMPLYFITYVCRHFFNLHSLLIGWELCSLSLNSRTRFIF